MHFEIDERNKLAACVLDSYWNISKIAIRLAQKSASSLGLTLQQVTILNTLHASPELNLKELTERLVSSKSTLSVNIDGLVKAGLVEREIPEQNRREIKLRLTERGIELSRQSIVHAASNERMVDALEHLSEVEVQQLLRLNGKVLEYLSL